MVHKPLGSVEGVNRFTHCDRVQAVCKAPVSESLLTVNLPTILYDLTAMPGGKETQSFLMEDEVQSIFRQSRQLSDALRDVVTSLGNRLKVDVCSIYLMEERPTSLVLAATVGLNQNCVDALRMGLDEGLAGMVAETLQPVSVPEAAKHPRFKYFPEAEEDAYESFLGVPIDTRGVLVVQNLEPRCYSSTEIAGLLRQAAILGRCLN